MRLHRLPEYFTFVMVLILGMAFAAWAGKVITDGQEKNIFIIIGAVIALAVITQLRERLWFFIPISVGLSGFVPALGVGITVHNIIVVYVFFGFLVFKAMKVRMHRPSFGTLDLLLLPLIIQLAFCYLRNPTGALGFDSERIGGKAYALVGVALLGYWVLGRVRLNSKDAPWLVAWMVTATCFNGLSGLVGHYFPGIGGQLSRFYSGFASASQMSVTGSEPTEGGIGRQTYLTSGGTALITSLCSFFPPISLLNPLYICRFLGFGMGMLLILLAGFRSAFFDAILFFYISGYLRNGLSHIVKSTVILGPILAVVLLGNGVLFNLPLPAQRALSFLPGQWDPASAEDAADSVEWRVDMWKDALMTDRYIQNKIFGDGFGVEKRVFDAVMTAQSRGISMHLRAEGQAIMGGFHSGPIATIRTVGYVGLLSYYLLTVAMSFHAWSLIKRAKSTPYFSMALFTCVNAIYHPFFFTFIGGAFDTGFPLVITSIGLMKMLSASINEYRSSLTIKQAEVSGVHG